MAANEMSESMRSKYLQSHGMVWHGMAEQTACTIKMLWAHMEFIFCAPSARMFAVCACVCVVRA